MGTRGGRRQQLTLRRAIAAAVLVVILVVVAAGDAWAQTPDGSSPAPATPGTAPGTTQFPTPPPPTIPSIVPPILVPPPAVGTRPAATFSLHPSITLTEEYTDNFRRTGSGQEDNFRTSITPAATLVIDGARTTGQISAGFSFSHDSSTGDIETLITSTLGGTVSWQPTPRTVLTLSDFFRRSDDPDLGDDLNLRRERGSFTSNVFTASAGWFPGTVSTEAYYRLATFINDESGFDDTISHAIGVNGGTRLGPLTSASAGYELLLSETGDSDLTGHQFTASLARQIGRFASAGVSGSYALRSRTGEREDDFTIWSGSLFANYALPGRWSLFANVGYSELESDREESRSSVTTQSTLAYVFARGTIDLSVHQGFSETFVLGEDFGVVETRGVSAGIGYRITPFVFGSGRAFYRENTFTGVGGRDLDGSEDVWGGSVGLSVQLRSWLSMTLDYRHTQVSSGPRGEAFSENRVRLSLTAGY